MSNMIPCDLQYHILPYILTIQVANYAQINAWLENSKHVSTSAIWKLCDFSMTTDPIVETSHYVNSARLFATEHNSRSGEACELRFLH